MANPNYTALLFILDVSGSMGGRVAGREEVTYEVLQNAMHKMLEEQARKLAGYITVDVGYFDGYAYFGEQNADPMRVNLSMYANGGTQLYDNTDILLTWFENRLEQLPEDEKPGHVIVVIATDGESNEPTTHGGYRIADRIGNLMSRDGWDFAFLGGYYGAFQSAYRLGLPRSSAVEDDMTPEGVDRMVEKLGSFVTVARGGGEARF